MRTMFNIIWGVTRFTFKIAFWFVGIILMLVVGSYPD